jgi:uncharacterized protein YjbJ (UPF0337 family)
MNWDIVEGKWQQLKGDLKSRWAKLTDDDVANLSAKREQLVGKIQERYGLMKDEAEHQVDDWLKRYDDSSRAARRPNPV